MVRELISKLVKYAGTTRKIRLILLISVCFLFCGGTAAALYTLNSPKPPTLISAKAAAIATKHTPVPDTKHSTVVASAASQPNETPANTSAHRSISTGTATASLDFTLSADNVTIQQGASTPTITAKTVNRNSVYWVVSAPPAAQSYMLVKFGITGGASAEPSDSFTIGTNPTKTQPGTYTGSVTAYTAGHLSSGITKTFTITVLPQSTFTISSFMPLGSYSFGTNNEDCLNFTLQWTLPAGTSSQPVTGTAYVAGLSPSDKVIAVNITGTNGCVLIQTGAVAETNNVVRLVVSDATYSTSATFYYSVL